LLLQVLVMEGGMVKEYDSVAGLMGRSDSTFKSMVIEAGLQGAASGSVSRVASVAALAAAARASAGGSGDATPPSAGGSPQPAAVSPASGRPLQGLPTFVRRLKEDYNLKE
jgi:hypothetical protein